MNKKKSLTVILMLLSLWVAAGYAEDTIKPEALEPVRYLPAADEENVYYKNPPVMAVDKDGNVYSFFLQHANGIIFKMSGEGKFVKNIGRRGEGPGDLNTPKYIKIKDDKLFVVDSYALSIFSLDGAFIRKFRIFNYCRYFDLFRDKIVTLEATKDHLFHIYTYNGKRALSFGKKYKINFSKFKGFGDRFVDRILHQGKVVCDQDHIYFLSYTFGDVFVYNDRGVLIKKGKLPGVNEDSIKKNIEYFFVKGAKIDRKRGEMISAYEVIIDCAVQDNLIYTLTTDNIIFVYEKKDFKLVKKYTIGDIPGRKKFASFGFYPVLRGDDKFFYVSLQDPEDFFIGVFKIKK